VEARHEQADRQQDPVPSASPAQGRSRLKAALLVLLVIAIGVGAFLALGAVFVYYSLSQMFKPPAAVPAPVTYVTQGVVLSVEHPVLHGHLSASAPYDPAHDLTFGVSAGIPDRATQGAASPALDPAVLISSPVVRISAHTGTWSDGCMAPCELRLAQQSCDGATCPLDVDLTIELLSNESASQEIAFDVAAAASTRLDKPLPDGVKLDLALDGAP